MRTYRLHDKATAKSPGHLSKKEEIETQNPLRKEPHFYRNAEPDYGVEGYTDSKKVFRTQKDFKTDSADPEEIDAQLTEAGVNEPQTKPDMSRDDARSEDREFELNQIGTEEAEGGLTDEDNDLEEITDRKATKVEGVKVDR